MRSDTRLCIVLGNDVKYISGNIGRVQSLDPVPGMCTTMRGMTLPCGASREGGRPDAMDWTPWRQGVGAPKISDAVASGTTLLGRCQAGQELDLHRSP